MKKYASGYTQKQTKEQTNAKPKPRDHCKTANLHFAGVSLAARLDTLEIADYVLLHM